MSQQWSYSKAGQRQGPVTTEKLKELAAQGQVAPTDLVWKEGMSQWVEARSIKGLFPVVAATTVQGTPPPLATAPGVSPKKGVLFCRTCGKELNEQAVACPGCGVPPLAGNQFCQSCGAQTLPAAAVCVKCGVPLAKGKGEKSSSTFLRSTPVVAASLLLCFPLGHFLVWTQPTWSRRKKLIWSGAGVIFLFLVTAHRKGEESEARRAVAEANSSWTNGKRAEAVSQYHAVIDKGITLVEERNRSLVLSRVVDYEAESGHTEEAKRIIRRCSGEDVLPESAAGKALVAQVKDELQQAAAKKAKETQHRGLAGLITLVDEIKLGKELTFNGGHLYYKPPVTEAEAQHLGRCLVDQKFFDGEDRAVQIQKTGSTYEFHMIIKKGLEHDDEFVQVAKAMALELSQNVFDGAQVDIHFCDDHLNTIRVIIAL
jgi:hypothetical protein